jgi:hypothetical protein
MDGIFIDVSMGLYMARVGVVTVFFAEIVESCTKIWSSSHSRKYKVRYRSLSILITVHCQCSRVMSSLICLLVSTCYIKIW